MTIRSNRAVLNVGAATVVVMLGLSACSSSSGSNSAASSSSGSTTAGSSSSAAATSQVSSATKTIKTLQFVNPLPDIAVWKQVGSCIGQEAKVKGIGYTQSGPPSSKPGDPTVMIQQVQAAVANGQNAIITFPASGAFGPVLQKAQKAGVLTATLYGDGTPASGATVNAGVDWSVIGTQYIDAIAARPGNHVVGLVAEGPTGIGKSWTDGMKAAAAKTKNVKISATVYIGADASQALPQVTNLLTAHPDIDIVASNTGLMSQGAATAIKNVNRQDKVHLLIINNANGAPELLKSGVAFGVFLQDLCDLGKGTVDGLVKAATGVKVPLIQVNDIIATQSNFAEYTGKGWS